MMNITQVQLFVPFFVGFIFSLPNIGTINVTSVENGSWQGGWRVTPHRLWQLNMVVIIGNLIAKWNSMSNKPFETLSH